MTISLPEASLAPDQPPEAVQLVALVLDQVSVNGEPVATVEVEAVNETVTLGWPSLEPPQAQRKSGKRTVENRETRSN